MTLINAAFANATSDLGLTSLGASGVLGLAFPLDSSISSSVGRSLLDNIFSNLDAQHRYLAFKLGSASSTTSSSSSFSIGQIDPTYASNISDFLYTPVFAAGQDYDYWKLPLLALTVNGQALSTPLSASKVTGSQTPVAVLDTGTTLILGPSNDVDAFWSAVGAAVAEKGADDRWRVRCDHAVSVGFVLGSGSAESSREFILSPFDVSWEPNGLAVTDGWCMGGIQSNDDVRIFPFHSFPWL